MLFAEDTRRYMQQQSIPSVQQLLVTATHEQSSTLSRPGLRADVDMDVDRCSLLLTLSLHVLSYLLQYL